jgi:hypothetical protein
MRTSILIVVMVGLVGSGYQAVAETQDRGVHQGHGAVAVRTLSEPGQGAFAALTEVVALLSADPATDWARVDITGLRNHLVDMDLLITATNVTQLDLPDGIQMTLQTSGAAGGAALRMVPAHVSVLAAETGWQNDVVIVDDVIIWTVTADTPEIVQALGFYGLMATGDHHRAHHMALALGQPMH